MKGFIGGFKGVYGGLDAPNTHDNDLFNLHFQRVKGDFEGQAGV